MNQLPTSTSFQGVLDSIIRSYLLNELPPEGGESDNARNQIAERDLGAHLLNPQIFSARVVGGQGGNEVNNNAGTSTAGAAGAHSQNLGFVNPGDHEYIKAIYQCFEKRGVFKELQTFLRHKLVSILQDEWPNLQKPVASTKDEPNTIVCRLVDDFLRCHKLLYTLSVLASESDVKLPCKKVLYGKLTSKEAEELLNDLGIKQSSRLSCQILKCYFDKEDFSLLESMHYLGIWLDESSILLDTFQQENNEDGKKHSGKRKGSCGESIVLSHHTKHNKEKGLETRRPCSCLKENKKEKGESSQISGVGVEERLRELERNLEKEKEFKIKEGIEKYKNEEFDRLRNELETKFKLQLVDKDREHFLEVQKRIDEININIQKERQQWLEEKIRQEKELCEMRKHLSEMVNASGDNLLRNATMHNQSLSSGENQSASKVIHMATKTCQVTLDDDSVVHKCSCKKQRCSCHNSGENSPVNKQHAKQRCDFHPVEQDRLAFLQYRMEQQDEEIKSLRRQLAVQISTSLPARKFRSPSQANGEPSPRGEQAISNQGEERSPRARDHAASVGNGKPDNLDSFLLESRRRVEILDTAVDRVDDIVQELFAKRRAPLSSELSARFLSEAVKKKKPPTPVYIPFPMNVPSTSVLSPMSYPSAVPLVHQQIPEKQAAYQPASLFHSTPADYNAVNSQNSEILTVIKPPPSERTPLRAPIPESPSVISENQDRPETPVDKIFEVAYGGPRQVRQNVKASPREVSEQRTSQSPGNDQSSNENSFNKEPEQEESLFHMAIRNMERESSTNGKKSLGEKAIRNGALSREKILSSDEGETSQSFSRSFREKAKSTTYNAGINGNGSKAISKSKVAEVDDSFPVKAGTTSTRNGGATQSPLSKLVKSKSSSSSSSKKSFASTRAPNKVSQGQSHSNHSQASSRSEQDEESSINISVPKSMEGDDNMEDFWQL